MSSPQLGALTWIPAADRPDLLAPPVASALSRLTGPVWVAEIDEDLADTAAFSEAYDVPLEASANCVVVAARRAGQTTLAACLVLATTRADVNGLVRRHLDARKASFAPQDVAVAESGMAFGGITPVGLPDGWPVLVDPAVTAADLVVIGSGTRGSKLAVPGKVLAELPAVQVLEGLGRSVAPEPAGPAPATGRPLRAPDDSDIGWGERPADGSDSDRRYLEDRPRTGAATRAARGGSSRRGPTGRGRRPCPAARAAGRGSRPAVPPGWGPPARPPRPACAAPPASSWAARRRSTRRLRSARR
ncbi:YbaK/EbsC family protein [Blastococcus brunescens]|uniref:YbaK/EbsC family protein n=1 Tax=Blastococcus brunescens TaxID=1564165 RepID=A0ABZ1B3D6_9ACTN|nr:YbaK/EbsC family protein [Blastococcus sp. BMG 8361]WRL64671.1 YbaK/EbsC family protein [Blastococcus sp. BMG 8361]